MKEAAEAVKTAQERPVKKQINMTKNTKSTKSKATEYHLVPTQYPKGHGGGSWTSAGSRARPATYPTEWTSPPCWAPPAGR